MRFIQKIRKAIAGESRDSHEETWENWQEKWDDLKVDKIWGEKLRNRDWQKDPAYRLIAQKCEEFGNSVIDLGSGGGVQYAALKEYFPEVSYTGIDITPRHVRFARSMFPETRFEEGDAADLPFKDREFDISLIRHVVEHHPQQKAEQILSEAFRVCKKCVLVLFFIPPIEMEEDVVEKRKKSGFYLNTYSKDWIEKQIKERGFSYEVVDIKRDKDSPALSDQQLYICSK